MPSPRKVGNGYHGGFAESQWRLPEDSGTRMCATSGGRDASGFRILSCFERSPRDGMHHPLQFHDELRSTPAPLDPMASAMLASEAKTQLLQANEIQMQVKDIHWITEKTLTLLHEVHQEAMVSKFNANVQKDREYQLKSSFDSISPAMLSAIRSSVVDAIETSPMCKGLQPKSSQTSIAATTLDPKSSQTSIAATTLDPKVATEISQLMMGAITESVSKAVQPLEQQLKETCKQHGEPSGLQQHRHGTREISLQTSSGTNVYVADMQATLERLLIGMQATLERLNIGTQAGLEMLAEKINKIDTTITEQNQEHHDVRSTMSPTSAYCMSSRPSSYTHFRSIQISQGSETPIHRVNSDGKIDIGSKPLGSASMESEDMDSQSSYKSDMAIKGAGGVARAPKLKDATSFSAVFANDTDLGTPFYDPEALYHTEGCAQEIARSERFFGFCSFMIVVNAIYIGIEADHNDSANLYNAAWPYIVCENFFCFYFLVELMIRIFAFKSLRDCFNDGWIRFDTFLVAMMVAETWVLMPILALTSGGDVSIPVGPLRLLRLLKITRMARMMRAFPELILMVKGMLKSLRAISGAMLLVTVMLYTFAIFEYMLLKGEVELNATLQEELMFDFSTLPDCMWTLGAAGVFLLDGAANVATYLVFNHKPAVQLSGWTFIIFTLITAMTILQMLIGVLCEVVSDTNRQHENARVIQIMKQQVMWKLEQFDDGDGKITLGELQNILADPECKSVFRSLNINRLFLSEMQKLMFPTKDAAVAFKPLTEMMLQCRGDQNATVETVASGLSYLATEVKHSQKAMERRIEKYFHHLIQRLEVGTTEIGARRSEKDRDLSARLPVL